MFLWNNLFFSLAFDGRDHYKAYGGDEAAHAAAVSAHTHTLLSTSLLSTVLPSVTVKPLIKTLHSHLFLLFCPPPVRRPPWGGDV